jgi:CubicO group peptidase (beta-lactamase class C family)
MNTKRALMIMRQDLALILVLLIGMMTSPAAAIAPINPADVTNIDTFVRAQVERHGIPGLALAIVEGDQVVHLGGYGRADETERAVTPQTPFVLASVSKPITALAVMQLVEAGKLELDAPVQRYLPEFRVGDPIASRQITIRHLLQHTSGIPEQGCQNSRFEAETLEEFVSRLRTIEPDAPAGARYFYCSGNYNVLGRVIEVVSGQSFASYIEQQVFAPLDMRHSFTTEQAAERAGLGVGYWWLFGIPVPFEYPYDVPQMPSGFLISASRICLTF